MAPVVRIAHAVLERDADSGCSGWSCYSSTQQAGIIFMAIVVPVVVGVVLWFVLIKPNLAYWKKVSNDARLRQEMERQVREDAVERLSSSRPPDQSPPEPPGLPGSPEPPGSPGPPEPPQEQEPEEQPSQPPEEPPEQAQAAPEAPGTPPPESPPPERSQHTPPESPLKLPPTATTSAPGSPAAEEVKEDALSINSPKSIQTQAPHTDPAAAMHSPPATMPGSPPNANGQKAEAEPKFPWAQNMPGMQQTGQGARNPMMPFPPFPPFAPFPQQEPRHVQQQEYPPGLAPRQPFTQFPYPLISVLPPPPPPPTFAAAGQQMPGSFPAHEDQPAYCPPPQPTYASPLVFGTSRGQQLDTPVSLGARSKSFPKCLFSKSPKATPLSRALTESGLVSEPTPPENGRGMTLSPMALPSETSSGENKKNGRRQPSSTGTGEEQRRRRRQKERERSRGRRRSRTRSEHSLSPRYSRGNGNRGRRLSRSPRRHSTGSPPPTAQRHQRRRARRESSRSCSPDHRRLQERSPSRKRSRLAFLAPLVPIALDALGIVVKARAQEQSNRLREAEEFSNRQRGLEQDIGGRRYDERRRPEHQHRSNTDRQPMQSQQGEKSRDKEKGKGRDAGQGSSCISGSTESSTFWRFRDSGSLRRHEERS